MYNNKNKIETLMDVLVVVHGKKKENNKEKEKKKEKKKKKIKSKYKKKKKKTTKREKKLNTTLQRFVSMEYTDFSLVQQWYAAGNEVAE
jgi:predicted ATP-dependent protease